MTALIDKVGVFVLLAVAGVSSQTRPEFGGPLALTNVSGVAAPGEALERVTIVIVGGRITALGADAPIPPGARVLDAGGLVAYPAFIDMFTRAGVESAQASEAAERRREGDVPAISEGPHTSFSAPLRSGVFAARRAEDALDGKDETFDSARGAGFGVAVVAPPQAIFGGQAALLSLSGRALRDSLLQTELAQVMSMEPPRDRQLRARGSYPATPLGVIAHTRQLLSDADWYEQLASALAGGVVGADELPHDADLVALQRVRRGQPVMYEADTAEEIHRALELAEEFRLSPIIVGGREAWRVTERLRSLNVPVVLALRFPEKAREYELKPEQLRKTPDDRSLYGKNWEKRAFEPKASYAAAKKRRDDEVGGAAALEKAGVAWTLTALGNEKAADFHEKLREAIAAGLPPDAALRALTTTPAKLLKLDQELGRIAVGQRANLAFFTRELSDKDAKLRWTIAAGRLHDYSDQAGGRAGGGSGRADRSARGGRRGARGDAPPGDEAAEPLSDSQPSSASAPSESQPGSQPAGPLDDLLLHEPAWAIETNAERLPGITTGGGVLLKHALVLTISGADLPDTDVLVERGKITNIGRGLSAPADVTTFDLTGYVVMPGIFDPHAHIALSAINEFSDSVVPEVRCADVIDPDDLDIFFALAGGCTIVHSMHGSANTIGGQCVVLKLKYGRPASELIVRDAPRTVKFALGENVKRSGMRPEGGRPGQNRENVRRFPGTRMGVETTLRRALFDGRAYAEQQLAAQRDAEAGRPVKPLRRDLRLEALGDIALGKIWVNCHSYRADEILRLLDVAEEFGIRVATLHHCLEAYRIIPEILRHGCGTATFADWWAYKIEAYDAVPQNAGMLLRAGINSTIKSDSSDLMRHLNHEAAKCLKSGGLTPTEALRLITLNPAREFGLEQRVGSIDVGKDGDLAVFAGHPLDSFSRCVLTLVEGEVYFKHREFDPLAPGRAAHAPPAVKPFDLETSPDGVRPVPPPAPTRAADGKPLAGYALVGGTLHPVSAPAIENGVVILSNGRIEALGRAGQVRVPPGYAQIDTTGLHVWPGLINAATEVGLYEIGAVGVTLDTNETAQFQPDVRAVSAFNPHSAMVEVTRAEGTTTVVVMPSGALVAGQAGLLNLDGWTLGEMTLDPQIGLVVNLPSAAAKPLIEERRRPRRGAQPDDEPEDEDAGEREAARNRRELEEFLRDARAYAQTRRAGAPADPAAGPADPRFEAMIPYVRGEKPVFFNAGSYKGILEALLFAEQLQLKPVIVGGADAWKAADVLAARKVPLIYEGVFGMPSRVNSTRDASEEWDANYRALSVLDKAGVQVCLSARSADLAKLLPLHAGFAVAHGLDPDAAVRMLTLSAARALGVDDRLGALEPGKLANVIVTTDHPCQATNLVKHMFIEGRPVPLDSKHARSARKFADRPAPNLPPQRTDLKGPPSFSRPGAQ